MTQANEPVLTPFSVSVGGTESIVWFVADDAAAVADGLVPHCTGGLVLLYDGAVTQAALLLRDALLQRGQTVRVTHALAAGEACKTPAVLVATWSALAEASVERDDTVVVLGGGAALDLGAFVASTILRGIGLIQVATTTLAMADAALGGKTAVNLPAGKNLVGTFWSARLVVNWLSTLDTLPVRDFRSGLAEVVKSALLAGDDDWNWLQRNLEALVARDGTVVAEALARAARLKGRVVSADPFERGERRLLNLGHTLGHAIEHAGGYRQWSHGESVSLGLVLAANVSVAFGTASPTLVDEITNTLSTLGLPTTVPSLTHEQWMAPLARDKKRVGSRVRFVLVERPGVAATHGLELDVLVDWLNHAGYVAGADPHVS